MKWRPHSHSWDKASFPGLIPLKTLELFTQEDYLIIHVKNSVSHLLKTLHLIKHRPDHQMVQIYTKPSKLVGTATNTKLEALRICIWWSYRKCSSYTVIFCFSLPHCYLHCHGPMRGVYEFWQFLFNYVLNHYMNDEVSMYFWHASAWIN